MRSISPSTLFPDFFAEHYSISDLQTLLVCRIFGLILSESRLYIPTSDGTQVITVHEFVAFVKMKRDEQVSKSTLYQNMIQERQNAANNYRLVHNNISSQNLPSLPPHSPVNNDCNSICSSDSDSFLAQIYPSVLK